MSAVAICTDSSAQLPAPLAERLGVRVVPLGIVLGDRVVDEPELDVDAFYASLAAGLRVSTSQPSPGRFAAAYAAAARGGAREIVSVHVGAAFSGTVGSAEIAARDASVPVHVVDTGTASFGVAACVLAAAEAVAAGGSAADAAAEAGRLAPEIGNVFVADGPQPGRLGSAAAAQLLSLVGRAAESLGPAGTAAEAVARMAAHLRGRAGASRVAVGHAGAAVAVHADALAAAVEAFPGADAVLRYRVGPSVGVHAGPGSFGAFWWPR